MLVAYQVATVVGIIVGYLAAYVLAPAENWRWMLGLAAIPAVAVLLLLLRLPDTARWYMMKGRDDDARRVLEQVDPDVDAKSQIAEISAEMREERGGGHPRDAAQAVPAGHRLRRRPGLLHPDHRHQRDRLLQPADLSRRWASRATSRC